MTHLTYFLSAALFSFLCVNAVRRWALRRQMLDIPNERSSHTVPTPRGGGLALVLMVLVLWGGWIASVPFKLPIPLYYVGLVMVASLMVAIISWLDDMRGGVPAWVRFTVHIAAALIAVAIYGSWQSVELPVVGVWNLGWIGVLITVFWIAGLINAYNFMDGIDGIAASQAITAAIGWVVIGWTCYEHAVSLHSMILAGACVGFLALNWPPARIFMGDVGSAFLGFCFAVYPLLMQTALFTAVAGSAAAAVTPRLPVAGFLLVAPFVLDSSFTFCRRLLKRENVFAAHRSHLYQRLVISGLTHQQVTLLYMMLGLIGTGAGILFALHSDRRLAWGVAVTATLLILAIPLAWAEFRERTKSDP